MNSIERKRTIAKIVLVISLILLVVFSLNLFFPEIFGGSHERSSSQVKDLETERKEIIIKYYEYREQIEAAEKNTNELDESIAKLGSYADKKVPKYAIGAGLSIVLGLWISTIILYLKISRDLFKE